MFLGMPVAISFLAINIIGTILFLGGEAGLQQRARNSVASYAALAARVPLDSHRRKKLRRRARQIRAALCEVVHTCHPPIVGASAK